MSFQNVKLIFNMFEKIDDFDNWIKNKFDIVDIK